MAIRRSDRERRRRAFLYALAAGRSVGESAEHAGIAWATLYDWRQNSASFAAAWDRAAMRARDALADRMQTALIQRGVEGVDEPVFHAGRLVGTRKRYSDALLLAGMREMTAPVPDVSRRPAAPPMRPRVIVEPLGPPTDEELRALGSRRPAALAAATPLGASGTSPAEEPVIAVPEPGAPETAPPEPEPALCWDHLGRH